MKRYFLSSWVESLFQISRRFKVLRWCDFILDPASVCCKQTKREKHCFFWTICWRKKQTMNCLIGLIEPHYNPTSKVLIQQRSTTHWFLYFQLENLQTSHAQHCHGRALPSKSTLLHCFTSANFLINNSVFNLLRKTKINLSDIFLSLSLSLSQKIICTI